MTLVIPIFIPHLGCPHDCLFCNQQKISGYRKAEYTDKTERKTQDHRIDVGEIVAQYLALATGKKYDHVQVAFYGGSFTCLSLQRQQELLAGVEPYLQKKIVHSIRCSTRPDCIDPEICEFLKEHKVTTVELGVQSLSDTVLQAAGRGHNAEQVRIAADLLKENGFELGIQLMIGLPTDTRRSLLRTIKKTIEIQPDFARLYPLLVVKDSSLEKRYYSGDYQPLSLNKAVLLSAKCYAKLNNAGIDVIRTGLQPSESLERSIVAGPYHPSFGELVQSRLWLTKLRKELAGLKENEHLQINISPRDMSTLIGNKRHNISRLDSLGFNGHYTIIQDKNLPRNSVNYVVSK